MGGREGGWKKQERYRDLCYSLGRRKKLKEGKKKGEKGRKDPNLQGPGREGGKHFSASFILRRTREKRKKDPKRGERKEGTWSIPPQIWWQGEKKEKAGESASTQLLLFSPGLKERLIRGEGKGVGTRAVCECFEFFSESRRRGKRKEKKGRKEGEEREKKPKHGEETRERFSITSDRKTKGEEERKKKSLEKKKEEKSHAPSPIEDRKRPQTRLRTPCFVREEKKRRLGKERSVRFPCPTSFVCAGRRRKGGLFFDFRYPRRA